MLFKNFFLLIIFSIIFILGCSQKPQDKGPKKTEEQKFLFLKKPSMEKIMPKQEAYMYIPRYKEIGLKFQVNPGFVVKEDFGAKKDYYVVHVIEFLKEKKYPANISLTFYPLKNDEQICFKEEMSRINKLRDVKIIEQGKENILEQERDYILYTYTTIFPIDIKPLNYVIVKEKKIFFKYKDKIYQLKFSALEDQYASKKVHYKDFVETLADI